MTLNYRRASLCYNPFACRSEAGKEPPVTRRDDPPLSGFLRVIYTLITAGVAFMVLLTAVTAFYDPPDNDDSDFGFGFDGGSEGAADSRDDYNRNVSLIFAATSAGLFGTAILGLGSRFNPIRSALLLGGAFAYWTSIGFWVSSSDQWVGFLLTLVNFAVLGVGFLYLDEGLPLEPKTVRRMEIPPAAGSVRAASPAPTPAPPPPQFAPPPRTMPPDEPTGASHETLEEPPGEESPQQEMKE